MIAIGLDLPVGTFREAGRYAFVFKMLTMAFVSDVFIGHTY